MTPGHQGKVCDGPHLTRQTLLASAEPGRWLVVRTHEGGNREITFTNYCPQCGIKLTPDEEALPMPEGCSEIHQSIYKADGGWRIMALKAGHDEGAFVMIAPTKAQASQLWKRCFGK